MTASWHTEYLYRKRFGGGHHEYMATPGDAIAWLVRIDQVYERRRATQGG